MELPGGGTGCLAQVCGCGSFGTLLFRIHSLCDARPVARIKRVTTIGTLRRSTRNPWFTKRLEGEYTGTYRWLNGEGCRTGVPRPRRDRLCKLTEPWLTGLRR